MAEGSASTTLVTDASLVLDFWREFDFDRKRMVRAAFYPLPYHLLPPSIHVKYSLPLFVCRTHPAGSHTRTSAPAPSITHSHTHIPTLTHSFSLTHTHTHTLGPGQAVCGDARGQDGVHRRPCPPRRGHQGLPCQIQRRPGKWLVGLRAAFFNGGGEGDTRVLTSYPVILLTPFLFPPNPRTDVPIGGCCGRGDLKVPRRDRPAGPALQEERGQLHQPVQGATPALHALFTPSAFSSLTPSNAP